MEARGSRSCFSKWKILHDPEVIEGFKDTGTLMLLRKLKRRQKFSLLRALPSSQLSHADLVAARQAAEVQNFSCRTSLI